MPAKASLGRGFEALIPKDFDTSILEEDKNRVQKLLISDIVPNPAQPRRQTDDAALGELANSIKTHGVLQPIIVVRHGDKFRIVAGERRWRGAKLAGLNEIPAIARSLEELEQLELSMIENIQRVDLSPLDQALSVYKLQQQFGLSLPQIAGRLGKAPSTLSNLTRLLQLPEAARQALADERITEGHARAILALKGQPQRQAELLELIIKNKWSVRQAEQFAVGAKKSPDSEAAMERATHQSEFTKSLSAKLRAPVKIRYRAEGGHLIIGFKDEDDLKRLADQIGKQ